MNKAKVRDTLLGCKQTLDYLYTQGVWPKGAFRQYENQIHEIMDALEELDNE